MNLRPPGYEPDELPSCSTPRHSVAFIGDIDYYTLFQQFCQEGAESFFAAEAEDENAAADLLSRKPAATPIHAPPRGATKRGVGNEAPARFQFTPLREGRPDGMLRRAGWAHFNSRPSARGDASCTLQIVSLTRFQFTPLREGRLSRYTFDNDLPDISIHAPPRGATMLSEQQHPLSWHFNSRPSAGGESGGGRADWRMGYFNSRPSARGDFQIRSFGLLSLHFNSRPSARGDAVIAQHVRRQIVISIHAPPRGATRGRSRSPPPRQFNSRPSARGDAGLNTADDITKLFQFTPLREGRHTECHTMAQADFISIHAPPRGATNTISRLSRHRHFNSRPSARGDTDSARVTGKALVFQFTPLREGRPQNEICLRPVTGFQFTPLREGRLTWSKRANTPRYFNSRPSARGDLYSSGNSASTGSFQFTPLREGRRGSPLTKTRTFW